MKTTITAAERLQLIGLLALAQHHNDALVDIARAAAALLDAGEVDAVGNFLNDKSGHLGDAIYGSRKPEELLPLLGITVDEN
jgi:hypothetical protein